VQVAGFGAEVAAAVAEAIGCAVARLGAPRIPVGYAPTLEAEARIDAARIAARIRERSAESASSCSGLVSNPKRRLLEER